MDGKRVSEVDRHSSQGNEVDNEAGVKGLKFIVSNIYEGENR